MLKNYKIGFDIWGLLLFLIIMIPNFIWFAVPAPNDILRVDSITKAVDTLGSVCQVLMIILLCILIHKERNKPKLPLIIAVVISCLLYFVSREDIELQPNNLSLTNEMIKVFKEG